MKAWKRRNGLASALVLSIGLVVAGCSSDITGDVYVTMKSGDVKRAAGVEVALVREDFMAEWRKGSTTFKSSWQDAQAAYKNARAIADHDQSPWGAASGRAREAAARSAEVLQGWIMHTTKLVEWATVKSVRTDVNGHYEIRGVSHGKYYLVAQHRVFDNELRWMVPVEVRGDQRIDLSNTNNTSWLAPIID